MVPRARAASRPARHLRRLHRPPAGDRRLGFDVISLTRIHPIGHTNRKGKKQHVECRPRRSGQLSTPSATRARPTPRFTQRSATLDDFRRLVEACRGAAWRSR